MTTEIRWSFPLWTSNLRESRFSRILENFFHISPLDLEAFQFHFHFSKRVESKINSLFISRSSRASRSSRTSSASTTSRPTSTSGFQRVPKGTSEYQRVPVSSHWYQRVTVGTSGYQCSGYQWVPGVPRRPRPTVLPTSLMSFFLHIVYFRPGFHE